MTHSQAESFPYTEDELRQQFRAATRRAAEVDHQEPRAVMAGYDKRRHCLVVTLTNGVVVHIPPSLVQGIAKASAQELATVTVSPQGTALHWEPLDADFSVAGLLAGVFGTRTWMVEAGRKGGQVTSPAKAAAARANGQKGGRPPEHKRPDHQAALVRTKRRTEKHPARRSLP